MPTGANEAAVRRFGEDLGSTGNFAVAYHHIFVVLA